MDEPSRPSSLVPPSADPSRRRGFDRSDAASGDSSSPDGARGLDDVKATGARRARRKRSPVRNAIEWILVIVGALAVALLVRGLLVQAFVIPSGSMLPTLQINDRVLVNKATYDLEDVERGDIIVFERPEGWASGDIDDLIKRVIALPGETISFQPGTGTTPGQVFVNGVALAEPWLGADVLQLRPWEGDCATPEGCTLGPDELFVLGDNRDNSDASNHYGPIPFDVVVGHAFWRIYPLGTFGSL